MTWHARVTAAACAFMTTGQGLDAQTPELSPCQQFLKRVEACVQKAPPELREMLERSLQQARETFARIDKTQKELREQAKELSGLAKDLPDLVEESQDAAERFCAQLLQGTDCGAHNPPM
jgi:hypothetical protein